MSTKIIAANFFAAINYITVVLYRTHVKLQQVERDTRRFYYLRFIREVCVTLAQWYYSVTGRMVRPLRLSPLLQS